MTTQAPSWTETQVSELKKLAGTMSASQIGARIGKSKDAVKNKIIALNLARYAPQEPSPKPPIVRKEAKPTVFDYRSPEWSKKKKKPVTPTQIEWCPECHSPVSDWAGHFERVGHRRPI